MSKKKHVVNGYESVDRPQQNARWPHVLWPREAVLSTAENGRAIRVPIGDVDIKIWRARVAGAAAKHGLKGHSMIDKDHLVLWCTKPSP
jgi:hypothetical protein